MIQLHDKTFEIFITYDEISFAIDHVAEQINDDFQDEVPLFLGVLNGSFLFASELIQRYEHACEVSFVKLASYKGTQTTQEVQELIGLNESIEGKSVVILEDIVDTGHTIEKLKLILKDKGAKRIKIATLFFKPDAYKKEIKIDYVGIRIPNKFIVGFGLDYNGLGRNLNDVYQLSENN